MATTQNALFCCALLFACIALVSGQTRDLQAVSAVGNFQLAYNRSVTGGDPLGNLPLDDPRLQRTVTGFAPEQVSVVFCHSAPGASFVSFVLQAP